MNPTLKLLLTGVRYTMTSISTAKYEVSIRVDFNHKNHRRSDKPIITLKHAQTVMLCPLHLLQKL